MNKPASLVVVSILASCVALVGCKKDKEGEGESAGKPAAAAEATWETKKIDVLGLQIETPSDTEFSDTSADAPNVSAYSESCSYSVSTVTIAYASDFESAKKEIEKDPNPFQKFTVEEETDSGWHLEYELKSMLDETPLYGVKYRTKIGDKEYSCGENERDASKLDCVRRACASLKP